MKGEERKEFLKEYKMSLISGSILTVSPSLAGILLWNRLPEKIATNRWQFLEFRFCFC